jgi:hypothetical protein
MIDGSKTPVVTPIDAAADAVDRDEESKLPEHELREERTAGGGVMSQGGTAVDRGTGTLDGRAQGPETDDDDALEAPDNREEVVPTSNLPR